MAWGAQPLVLAPSPIPVFSNDIAPGATGTFSVPVPCQAMASPTPGNPLRSCDSVMTGQPATLRGPAAPGLPTLIYNRVKQQAQCAYQGIDYDPSKATSNECAGPTFGHPCSLVPNPFNNNQSEANQDHSGQSCTANMMKVTVNHGHCALPQVAPAPASSEESQLNQILATQFGITDPSQLDSLPPGKLQSIFTSINMQHPNLVSGLQSQSSAGSGQVNCIYFNATKPNGEQERIWSRGAWIQALAYYTSQVLNEITCNHAVQVGQDPRVDGCAVFAADAITQYNNAVQTGVSTLGPTLGGASAKSDIDFCTADWSPVVPTQPNGGAPALDPGRLRQAATHLCAARSNLETMFAQLATCEIFQRTRAGFNQKIGLTEATRQTLFIDNIINGAAMRAQCDYCRKSNSYSEATSCMQSCYQKYVQQDFQQYLQNSWNLTKPNSCAAPGGRPYGFPAAPSNGKSSSSASDLLGFGFLAGSLQRRRRRHRPVKKTRRQIRSLLSLIAIVILAGCSQAQNLPSIPTPDPSNVACAGGDPACCSNPPPASCVTENPGGPGQSGTGQSGGAEVTNTATEIAAAQQMASNANGTNGGYSAENLAPPGQASGSGAAAMGSNGAIGGGMGAMNSGGSGSGSNSSNPSLLGDNGAGSPGLASSNPSVTDAASGQMGANSASDQAPSYAAGAGINGSGKDGAGSGFLFGNGLMHNVAGANGMGFGNTREPDAMNGTDPADYFQRIAIDADLFKQVENRYRKTSASWAASAAQVGGGGPSDAGSAVKSVPQKQP